MFSQSCFEAFFPFILKCFGDLNSYLWIPAQITSSAAVPQVQEGFNWKPCKLKSNVVHWGESWTVAKEICVQILIQPWKSLAQSFFQANLLYRVVTRINGKEDRHLYCVELVIKLQQTNNTNGQRAWVHSQCSDKFWYGPLSCATVEIWFDDCSCPWLLAVSLKATNGEFLFSLKGFPSQIFIPIFT